MSPIIARAGIRMAGRRQFSVMQSLRSFARSMEAHPFERVPVTTKSQAPDWGRLVRRTGGNAVFFFPTAIALLGWPFAAKFVLDGHMGQL